MRINRKGFTLIELLAVVVVISIILALSFRGFSSYLKSSREKLKKIEEERIIDAGSMYYTEFKDSDDYKSFINNEDNSVNSCIGINTLISKGFYKGKVKFIDDNNFNLVKVKEINGVPNFELVSYKDRDPKLIEDCIGEEISRLLDSGTVVSMSSGEEGEVTLETSINSTGNNQYSLSLVVTQKSIQTTIEQVVPLYVLIVLDASTSMNSNYGQKYNSAKEAAINMSKSIAGRTNSSVGLITFNEQPTLQRGFSHTELTQANFPNTADWTDIVSALKMSYNQLASIPNNNANSNAIKYAVFLTDGYPQVGTNTASSCYYEMNIYNPSQSYYTSFDRCIADIITAANSVKNTGTNFVVVGYELDDPTYVGQDLSLYQDISSVDETGTNCPTSNYTDSLGKKHCYYDANSSDVSSIFDSISNSIISTVNNQSIGRSVINATLDKSIKIYDSSGNEITDLVIDIDFSNSSSEIDNEYTYTYSFTINNIDANDFKCYPDKDMCIYDQPLFSNYLITLYDIDNNIYKEVKLDNSPIVTIEKKLGSYLN